MQAIIISPWTLSAASKVPIKPLKQARNEFTSLLPGKDPLISFRTLPSVAFWFIRSSKSNNRNALAAPTICPFVCSCSTRVSRVVLDVSPKTLFPADVRRLQSKPPLFPQRDGRDEGKRNEYNPAAFNHTAIGCSALEVRCFPGVKGTFETF